MSQPTLSLGKEIEALTEAYAALNRNDVAGFVRCFDPQIERIEPADIPSDGIFHGIAAVIAHVEKGRGGWAEGTCEPTRFVVAGDRIVVVTHVHVRLKSETTWREGETGDVFTFRNGKVIQFRTFWDSREALEWAGAKD